MTAVAALKTKNDVSTASHPAALHVESDKRSSALPREFEGFVRDYTERLLAVARRLLRSEDDAADAVQEAFLSALAARETFRGASAPFTWLYRIVVNACLMKIRSKPRARVLSLECLLPTFDDSGRHRHPVAAWSQSAENSLERDELRAAVRACIDKLPDDYRTILLLRDIEQLDTEETAELLHLSYTAAKTRLHRARQALRALLESVLL